MKASTETIVRELADIEAIRNLARRYAHCVWQKDIVGAAELFTEDGEMDTGDRPAIKGREALIDSYRRMLGGADFHPFVHNHLVHLEGDRGTGVCYLDLRATVEGKSMIGFGYYDDHYVRIGGQWKFRSRKLTMCHFVPIREGWAKKQGKG